MQNPIVICPHCQEYSTLDYRRTSRGTRHYRIGICSAVFFGFMFLILGGISAVAVVSALGFIGGIIPIYLGKRDRDWHCAACGNALHLSEDEINQLQNDATTAMEKEASRIISGEIPPPVAKCLVEGDERVLKCESCSLLEERVIRRHYVGGSNGVSFRVAKGVRFRVGAHRGHMESERGTVPVSQGELIVTTKRVIFTGHPKSLVIRFGKIASVEGEGPVLAINESGKPNLRAFKLDRPVASLMEILIRNASQNLGN